MDQVPSWGMASQGQETDFINAITIQQILTEWQLHARHCGRETWAPFLLRIKFRFLAKVSMIWPLPALPIQRPLPLCFRMEVLTPDGPSCPGNSPCHALRLIASHLWSLGISSLEMSSWTLPIFYYCTGFITFRTLTTICNCKIICWLAYTLYPPRL